jgi:superfamily II DNA or RNA helicase
VPAFQRQMAEGVHLIFSTTVLSHGVNLPPVRWIVFSYEEKNEAIFLQMRGRGGRRGQDFGVFVAISFGQWAKKKIRTITAVFQYYRSAYAAGTKKNRGASSFLGGDS